MKYVGVDGCRGGWFAVCLDDAEASFCVFSSFSKLWEVLSDARLILVDIPIGLPGKATPSRQADMLARQYLSERPSSVFSPGARPVLGAPSYAEACEVNRKVTGKKISQQYWNIVPKVKDVDSFLQATPEALETVRESHPEICFQAAFGAALSHSKKKPTGIQERLAVLRKYESKADNIYESALQEYLRKTVARDDILDAMILAVTARDSQGIMVPLPDPPERDETGLPMAIWTHKFERPSEGL